MFKKILGMFKGKKDHDEDRLPSEIELSKIDKHMNFILRDKLGTLNRTISEKIVEINTQKGEVTRQLRILHKKPLMNPNISQREIQIMEGNRENYVKKISHFIANIELPKNYIETYDYCIRFSNEMEHLYKDIQKNIFVLQHFFSNEIKDVGKGLNGMEQLIIDIRSTFEKNGIDVLKDMQEQIKQMTKNIVRIGSLDSEIEEHKKEISSYQEKLDKLNQRIMTITSGTDYRMLESFKEEKDRIGESITSAFRNLDKHLSELETALKKYYYKNQDRKIIKGYIDARYETFLQDTKLELVGILAELKSFIVQGSLELKDKKKEHAIHSIDSMTPESLRELHAEIMRLEDHKQRTQAKITHNSAALNMSEQQYWINTTKDKIKHHQSEIDKRNRLIMEIREDNKSVKENIRKDLESMTGESIIIKDDLDHHISHNSVENMAEK
jgi:hypothetical protein